MLDAVSAHTDCLIQIVKERHSYRVDEAHLTLLNAISVTLFNNLNQAICVGTHSIEHQN